MVGNKKVCEMGASGESVGWAGVARKWGEGGGVGKGGRKLYLWPTSLCGVTGMVRNKMHPAGLSASFRGDELRPAKIYRP